MLCSGIVRCLRSQTDFMYCCKAYYSRRANEEKYYKIVGKVENAPRRTNTALAPVPNWELLRPRGYRFYMPGSVGPAWHDAYTTAYSLPQDFDLEATDLECYAQECPLLLRTAVKELFPGIDLSYSRLTVISLTQKLLKKGINEFETEAITTKKFVLTAQDICRKLKASGYWSDFINPFSGLPCINVYSNSLNIYRSDPRFRCLGFQIVEVENCLVIDKTSQQFIGSLFTTAPTNTDVLQKTLLHYQQ